MEVSLSVQTGDLCPLILSHVIQLTLVHGFVWQRGTNSEYLTLLPLNKHARQSVSPPLKKHVPPLYEPFLDKFIAEFGRFARLTASRQEYPTLFVLD